MESENWGHGTLVEKPRGGRGCEAARPSGSGYTVGKSALFRHFWFTASSGRGFLNFDHNAQSSGRFYKLADPVDAMG